MLSERPARLKRELPLDDLQETGQFLDRSADKLEKSAGPDPPSRTLITSLVVLSRPITAVSGYRPAQQRNLSL
jgi:hypothetical protein